MSAIPGEPSRSWPQRGRVTFPGYVFHPRADDLLALRVCEDVEPVVPQGREDAIGDLPGRHPRLHQLAEGFPPLSIRSVPGTVPRRLHDPRVDDPRAEHRDLDLGPALGQRRGGRGPLPREVRRSTAQQPTTTIDIL